MAYLNIQQRSLLENTVIKARRLAEIGATNALQALAVHHPEPFSHLLSDQRSLRNHLRCKARLLGDELLSNGTQEITHLSYELAYEYWHKMLFAKFLEVNNLLMHPSGVYVRMAECEDLAKEERYTDKWEAAAYYASIMLPAIFRPGDPLMKVYFATEDRLKLEELLEKISDDIFKADDSLGWVYQFWQSEAVKRINESEEKIDGAKLSAKTQYFTEPYMVHFLIDNTIGAWWVSRNPGIKTPVSFDYLRFLENGSPAAGKFEGWPDKTAEITTLDPCMGSGHFLALLFSVLAPLRMHEEGLTKEEATVKVITENLHGLELDARCTQIAAFNLALTAWKFCGKNIELPEMNLACTGIAPKGKKEDWVKLVGKVADPVQKNRMENGMEILYDHFQLAPELGSLLDPSLIKADAFSTSIFELQSILERVFESKADKDLIERGVMAAGIAKASQILGKTYILVTTNVPYLGQNHHCKTLSDYCKLNYKDAKADIATVFIERINKIIKQGQTFAIVSPQNWLFQSAYKKFRSKLLNKDQWNILVRMGGGAFSQISGEVVKAILLIITNSIVDEKHFFGSIDVSKFINSTDKDNALKKIEIIQLKQLDQLENPDFIIKSSNTFNTAELLSKHCYSAQGIGTTDNPQFVQSFWEHKTILDGWVFFQTAATSENIISGYHSIFCWEGVNQKYFDHIKKLKAVNRIGGGWQAGSIAWGFKGFGVNVTSKKLVTLYSKEKFDTTIGIIVVKDEDKLLSIYAFLNSPQYTEELVKIDQSLSVTEGTLIKVPFILDYWQKIAQKKYPDGLPSPYSNDPTQWLFHGNTLKTENPLLVAVARLLSYRWPAESDAEMELAEEARDLIAQIKVYDSLSDEDGIVCIPSVNKEQAAAERLRSYLQTVFGSNWKNNTLEELLNKEGSKANNLESWLRDDFFAQHCKVFQNRPFIWQIWDGRKDGFSVLVNYHNLTKDNLSKLIYTYLGDWILQCEHLVNNGESGAEGLLSAALKLKEKLELILIGEQPYDIFVRWKSLAKQPIGWDPDINDGVRLNIRPFVTADILRKKPNIKWGIDRGKNSPGSPWGEIRDNDLHKTLEEKRIARNSK